uniref:Uncharacterized protein n=1 Tax=Oryza sativa subsp. japonica TaxID=39947 RepID=Q5ZA85_ORYSJ|nr:hypothetical protein [Oryza sativa Japonica Group]
MERKYTVQTADAEEVDIPEDVANAEQQKTRRRRLASHERTRGPEGGKPGREAARGQAAVQRRRARRGGGKTGQGASRQAAVLRRRADGRRLGDGPAPVPLRARADGEVVTRKPARPRGRKDAGPLDAACSSSSQQPVIEYLKLKLPNW